MIKSFVVVSFCLFLISCDMSSSDTVQDQLDELAPDAKLSDFRSIEFEGFTLYSYFMENFFPSPPAEFIEDGKFHQFRVDHKGKKVLTNMVSPTGKRSGLDIFNANSELPILSLVDLDGDGVYDSLTYTIQDENGDDIATISDRDFDGQPDTKVDFRSNKGFAWIDDAWREITIRNKVRYVEIDGISEPIELLENIWKKIE
ncbi:MAG: hypothetical protein MI892_29990 [Desulfobacterales bacterium]|nr:hypothetical protein [Desulfobacterales bacterium]